MNLQNMDYQIYYYNFEIYSIEEAKDISMEIDKEFKDCAYFDSEDKSTMSKYQKDFEKLCNKLISKDIDDIEEYVQITDSLIIISAKSQKFLHKLRKKYRNECNRLKKIAGLQKKTDSKIGAESLLDLLLDAYFSYVVMILLAASGTFLLYVGIKTENIVTLIIGLIFILFCVLLYYLAIK